MIHPIHLYYSKHNESIHFNFRKLLKMLHTKDKGDGGTQNKTKMYLYLPRTLFSKQPLKFWPIVLYCAQESIQHVVSIFRTSWNVLLSSFSLCGTTVPSIGKSYREQTLAVYYLQRLQIFITLIS